VVDAACERLHAENGLSNGDGTSKKRRKVDGCVFSLLKRKKNNITDEFQKAGKNAHGEFIGKRAYISSKYTYTNFKSGKGYVVTMKAVEETVWPGLTEAVVAHVEENMELLKTVLEGEAVVDDGTKKRMGRIVYTLFQVMQKAWPAGDMANLVQSSVRTHVSDNGDFEDNTYHQEMDTEPSDGIGDNDGRSR
jgi:hypothetical protein